MPWCPVCKEEYKEGISICPDCSSELVESLQESDDSGYKEAFRFSDKKMAEKFVSYLEYSGVKAKSEDCSEEVLVYVHKNDLKKAKKHFSAFYSVESADAIAREINELKEAQESVEERKDPLSWSRNGESESGENIDEADAENIFDEEDSEEQEESEEEIVISKAAYVKKADKARDLFSTAVTFIGFGIAGSVFILLNIFGLLSIMNTPLFYIVGAVVFITFTVIGINAALTYKKTVNEAKEEEELTERLFKWLDTAFNEQTKDEFFNKIKEESPDISEEILYLELSKEIKRYLTENYPQIAEDYLDYIVEEYYNSKFSLNSES